MSHSEKVEPPIKVNLEHTDEQEGQSTSCSAHAILNPSQECEGHVDDSSEDLVQPDENNHSYIIDLLKNLEACQNIEAKVHLVIDFMASSLAQEGTPHFKSFWQARSHCLLLFKEHIAPTSRATLWLKYSELSKEARRLKELLDEQSAFAVEQLDMAITSLEEETAQLTNLNKISTHPIFTELRPLQHHLDKYNQMQHELDLLNAYASRINALRKELIKTEMRVRKKNKLFQRLSQVGDLVFPRRKEVIKEVGQLFNQDIEAFITAHFSRSNKNENAFDLRDDIKDLQAAAKRLTLNSHVFTHTRQRLSECWDKLKEMDKERKQRRLEQKAVFKEHIDGIQNKINAVNAQIATQELSSNQALQKFDEIASASRQMRLPREENYAIRDLLDAARRPVLEKLEQEARQRQELEQEKIRHKLEKIEKIKDEIKQLIDNSEESSVEILTEKRDLIVNAITVSDFSKTEKQDLERLLKPLRDILSDKKEKSLLNLSKDQREALMQLRDLLSQRKDRRNETKEQIEVLRKANGSSGLDFVKAMEFQVQLNDEKERLEKIDQSIEEIELKIAELEEAKG